MALVAQHVRRHDVAERAIEAVDLFLLVFKEGAEVGGRCRHDLVADVDVVGVVTPSHREVETADVAAAAERLLSRSLGVRYRSSVALRVTVNDRDNPPTACAAAGSVQAVHEDVVFIDGPGDFIFRVVFSEKCVERGES